MNDEAIRGKRCDCGRAHFCAVGIMRPGLYAHHANPLVRAGLAAILGSGR